jgi:hypothetical protein
MSTNSGVSFLASVSSADARVPARAAIESLSKGQPPSPELSDFISVGIERDLNVFEEEYFGPDGLLPIADQGTFKMVEAFYGGGKTHYLRAVERRAHANGFASAFVELHKDSCPLTRFDKIYAKVVEMLQLPPQNGGQPVQGLANVIRAWIAPIDDEVDPIEFASAKIAALGDLPLPSMRIALRDAAHAIASEDRNTLDEILVFLHSGKISAPLRRRGILEPIDVKSGSLALRSLAHWLRQIGVPGLVLIMDEGDRSLSIASTNDRISAANNLRQLINETTVGAGWPGVMFLYSIPSWQAFLNAFRNQPALEMVVKSTGFPSNPLAPRIVLDDRFSSDNAREAFCVEVGGRIAELFGVAYPSKPIAPDATKSAAELVAKVVVQETLEVSFRRIFVQAYIAALFRLRSGEALNRGIVEQIVAGEASKIDD